MVICHFGLVVELVREVKFVIVNVGDILYIITYLCTVGCHRHNSRRMCVCASAG